MLVLYTLLLYDARAARKHSDAQFRQELNSRVLVMQNCYQDALRSLRTRQPGVLIAQAFRLWTTAFETLRDIDPLTACHEAVSHMDMFTRSREMNMQVHEAEYGRDMHEVAAAFCSMSRAISSTQPLPQPSLERIRRLVQQNDAYQMRQRVRQSNNFRPIATYAGTFHQPVVVDDNDTVSV